jgi:Rrf2 family protein
MRLQLTRRADYAVRATLALAEAGQLLPAGELALRMAIPPGFLPQILPALVRNGILGRSLGRHGGYVLARDASGVSLLEVIDAADGTPPTRTCVLRGGPCRGEEPCAVHPAVADAQEAMRVVLSGATFASLVGRRRPGVVRATGD